MLYFQYVLIKFYAGMGIKKNVERYYYIYVDDNNKIKLRQTCLPGLVINATDRFSTPF